MVPRNALRVHSAGFVEQGHDAIRCHIAVSLKHRYAASWCLTAETFIAAKANLIKLHFGEADCPLAKLVMDKEHLGELKERIQSGAKLDTEVQALLDTIEERKKEAAADVVLLSAFLRRCYMLSMLNVGTMPLTFALAFYNFTCTNYAGICLKFGLSLIVQYVLLLRLRSWLNNMSGDEVQKFRDVVELEFTKLLSRSSGCHEAIMLILRPLGLMMDTTLKVVEAVDPDFDAATAGSSWNMLEVKEKEIFARSWTHVPVMSWIVAKGNLPGVLLLLLLFAAGEQIRVDILQCWRVLEHLDKKVQISLVTDRVRWLREVFNGIYHVCDIGGLMLLTRVVMDLDKAHRGSYPMDRLFSFLKKEQPPQDTKQDTGIFPLKSIFAPAFPCLTGLLRAPLWEGQAMVFLVSQRWLDAVVVLIALLLSIVLVNRFVNLLPARWPLWRSKADLPLVMLLFTKLPGIIVLVSELARMTLFPRWLRVMRSAVEVSWSAKRSRASRATRSVALLKWSRQAMAAWTSTSCGYAGDDAAVSHAPSCSSTLLTIPSRIAVGAGSYCTVTMTGALG